MSLSINGSKFVRVYDTEIKLQVSDKIVFTQSLRVLCDCGILLRYKGMVFTTVAKKEFFERRDNT